MVLSTGLERKRFVKNEGVVYSTLCHFFFSGCCLTFLGQGGNMNWTLGHPFFNRMAFNSQHTYSRIDWLWRAVSFWHQMCVCQEILCLLLFWYTLLLPIKQGAKGLLNYSTKGSEEYNLSLIYFDTITDSLGLSLEEQDEAKRQQQLYLICNWFLLEGAISLQGQKVMNKNGLLTTNMRVVQAS